MKCRFQIGSFFVDLAGSNGASSDTQGLTTNYEVTSESVSYIGVDESRQFSRPGSSISASFSSVTEYASVANAEAEMAAIYEVLKSQQNAIAYIGGIDYTGSSQVETATASGTALTEATVITGLTGSTIYYTTDGTDPTTSSATISSGGKVTLAAPFTLKTFAAKAGLTSSPILTRNFIATGVVNEATVTPDSSAVVGPTVSVVITNQLPGVSMFYTINGTNPTTSSTPVSSGDTVTVLVPGTLKVLSTKIGLVNSPIKEARFITKAYANVTNSPQLVATGATSSGIMIDSGTAYQWHQFDTTGSIEVTAPGSIDYLLVGGGGAGGGRANLYNSGGGGAGEVKHVTGFMIPVGTYNIAAGAGGVASTNNPTPATADGGSSTIGGLYTAVGGGGGATGFNKPGRTGASGGGGTAPSGPGGAGSAGNNGGAGIETNQSGGGGGSTAAGVSQATPSSNVTPAAGTTININGTSTEFAKGGGVYPLASFPALTKGSGGSGRRDGGTLTTTVAGQSGADGVVIIRYPINYEVATPSITPTSTAAAVGNIVVTVSQTGFSKTITVPVTTGTTASSWAGTIRTALSASPEIKARYTVSGSGASIILTSKNHQADPTMNISIANGTPGAGITAAPISSATSAGSADSVAPIITIFDAIAQVSAAYRGKSLSLNATITGRTTAP